MNFTYTLPNVVTTQSCRKGAQQHSGTSWLLLMVLKEPGLSGTTLLRSVDRVYTCCPADASKSIDLVISEFTIAGTASNDSTGGRPAPFSRTFAAPLDEDADAEAGESLCNPCTAACGSPRGGLDSFETGGRPPRAAGRHTYAYRKRLLISFSPCVGRLSFSILDNVDTRIVVPSRPGAAIARLSSRGVASSLFTGPTLPSEASGSLQ